MKISKKRGYSVYSAELSYAELIAIQAACAKDPNPVSDEMGKTIEWYVANDLPGPGEEEKPSEADANPEGDEGEGGEEKVDELTLLPNGADQPDLEDDDADGFVDSQNAGRRPAKDDDLDAEADRLLPKA